MRKIVILLLALCSLAVYAQKVSDATFIQSGEKVVITYTLDKAADITVYLSTDGGKTFGEPLNEVVGKVGKKVQPGRNTIIWTPLKEMTRVVSDQVVFMIEPSRGEIQTFTVKDVQFNMVFVEGGTFMMGCTEDQGDNCPFGKHQVTLSDFYIGQTEVTQELWQAVMDSTIYAQRNLANPIYEIYGIGDKFPMYYINYNDCQKFVQKLNELTGKHFAIPTEAQWEYAARGGNKSQHTTFSGSMDSEDVAWHNTNSDNTTHKVGTKKSNELDIYDMSGNVNEWCKDNYAAYQSYAQTNPQGPSDGTNKVIRGGSWLNHLKNSTVANRTSVKPTIRYNTIGLRLVLLP